MKKVILLTLVSVFSLSLMAQDDDMYFVPTKENKAKEAKMYGMPQNTYYSGSNRSVDDYNRRAQFSYPVDSTGNDIIDFSAVRGVYPDSVAASAAENDDYKLTRQMSRFDDYTPSEAYWDGYRAGRWSSPWYNSWYSWYDPWYYDSWWYWNDPFYYSSWHYGWYYPYYYSTWYSPRYYSYRPSFGGGYRLGGPGSRYAQTGIVHSHQRKTTNSQRTNVNNRSHNYENSRFNSNTTFGGSRNSSINSGSFGGSRSTSVSSGGGSRSVGSGGGRSVNGGRSYGGRR